MFIRSGHIKKFGIFLFIIFGMFFMPIPLQAVMPPPNSKYAKSSPIKVIAVVENIKALDKYDSKITFSIEQSFGVKTVQEFEATCPTGNYSPAKPGMTGGVLYYTPKEDDRVFVTVDNSGYVTSYTKISPELDNELKQNGLKNITFHMGRASIVRNTHQNTNKMNTKEMLEKGRTEWKTGKLDKALLTLDEAAKLDPSNKKTAKVLKSMQLQKKKIDGLLNTASSFIEKNNYEDAKKSLEKASLINSQYESYQKVFQKLTYTQNYSGEKILTEDDTKRIKSLLTSSKKFQDVASHNYAEALLLLSKDIGKLQLFTIDKELWDNNTSQYGWMVFFSSAIRIYNKDPQGLPIVGYYNPYSDTLLITVWGKDKKNYKIVDAEIIMGNMLHKKGDFSSHIPLWLQNKRNYKVFLGLEVAQTIVSFENTFSSSTYSSWRDKLQVLDAKDRVLKFNYIGVSLMLNRHLLDILNYINPKKDDIKLIKLKNLISKIIELLSTGNTDKILKNYKEITPESIQVIKSISPKWFKTLKISKVFPTSDGYLIFFSSSSQTEYSLCFSAKYINDTTQVEIDLLGFQYFYDEFKVRLGKIKKGDL